MLWRVLADLILVVHLAFVLFVVLGGLLALRWRRIIWVHAPAALWGMLIEFAGWICPLTPLENWLRVRGGAQGYPGDFMERYILPVLYPLGLTPDVRIGLGVFVAAVNLLIYWWVFRRSAGRSSS